MLGRQRNRVGVNDQPNDNGCIQDREIANEPEHRLDLGAFDMGNAHEFGGATEKGRRTGGGHNRDGFSPAHQSAGEAWRRSFPGRLRGCLSWVEAERGSLCGVVPRPVASCAFDRHARVMATGAAEGGNSSRVWCRAPRPSRLQESRVLAARENTLAPRTVAHN